MKNTYLLFLILLAFTLNSCNKLIDPAAVKAESLLLTSLGTVIGNPISVTINANGGTGIMSAIGAKITVPAGAMVAGSPLTLQQVSNVINADEKAMRISGEWTKPIVVEYQVADNEPSNYNIFVSTSSGAWVGARNAKISGNTISVRLGANAGSTVKSARYANKTYDLAFSKVFTVKPSTATLDLGKTQTFTAYAKEGFVPRKAIDGSEITSKEAMDEYIKKIDEIAETVYAEDDVVPLAPLKNASADDEVVPLPIIAKEYPFSDSKTGFSRKWGVTGVGTVKSDGKYTAPSDEASKGKTAQVIFTSINDKTGKKITASARVRIKGGLQTYVGTMTATETYNYDNGKGNTETYSMEYNGKFYLKQKIIGSKFYGLDISQPNSATLTSFKRSVKNGIDEETDVLNGVATATFDKFTPGSIVLNFPKVGVYFIGINEEAECKDCKMNTTKTSSGTKNYTFDFYKDMYFNTGFDDNDRLIKLEDSKVLVGSRTYSFSNNGDANIKDEKHTRTVSWNFKLEE